MSSITAYNLQNKKSIISFSGTDAASFLQGQTTCDVLSLDETNSVFGALCNPKGRVISLFHLVKRNDIFYMTLPSDLCADIIKRLKMFVFRSKVNIDDVTNQFIILGINETLTEALASALAYIRYTENDDLALLLIQNSSIEELSSSFTISSDNNDWENLLISACIPEITAETSEQFIPQMLNLDVLKGISFQKGCYTGQEVVARMHYKGSVKRRLTSYQSSSPFDIGEQLFIDDNANSIGTILNSVSLDNLTYTGLAVLKVSFTNDQEIALKKNVVLNLQHPTYQLD